MLDSNRWFGVLKLRRRSGRAALIAICVLGAALVIGGGLYFASRTKEPPKVVDAPAASPADEAARQAAGEANLGAGGNEAPAAAPGSETPRDPGAPAPVGTDTPPGG